MMLLVTMVVLKRENCMLDIYNYLLSLQYLDSMVLVDGNRTVPGIPLTQRAVVGGDAKCPSISAASILAKVTRDHLLIEYDRLHPEYGFAKHKGYGTKEHVDAILKYGALDIHRKSFLKNVNKSL